MEKVKNPSYVPKYSLWNGFSIILREEGWRGFYKGHLTNLMHVAPSAATRFYLFELAKKVAPFTLQFSSNPSLSPRESLQSDFS